MLIQALQLEVADYVAGHTHERDEEDRAFAVRNGKARPRQMYSGLRHYRDRGRDAFATEHPGSGSRVASCRAVPSRLPEGLIGVLPIL
jgi:hypothetical protein